VRSNSEGPTEFATVHVATDVDGTSEQTTTLLNINGNEALGTKRLYRVPLGIETESRFSLFLSVSFFLDGCPCDGEMNIVLVHPRIPRLMGPRRERSPSLPCLSGGEAERLYEGRVGVLAHA